MEFSKMIQEEEQGVMGVSYSKIGQNIRELRKERGITQQQMAQWLNLSPGYYGKMERGMKKISLDHLSRIGEILDVPIEILVAGAAEEKLPQLNRHLAELTNGCTEAELAKLLEINRMVLGLHVTQ